MSGWPVRFSGKTPPIKAAPLLGQHNAEVLADWLGMDEGKIGGLRSDAVIGG
jgi:formyl-CoA transferase